MERRAIERTPDGDFRLRLAPDERDLLRSLPTELCALLEGDLDDPSLRRLFPPGHPDDPEAEAVYQRLVRDGLAANRREALRLLERTADRERLLEGELHDWLRAVNDLRLVFATRLEVTAEGSARELVARHPGEHALTAYAYLTWLQQELMTAVAPKAA